MMVQKRGVAIALLAVLAVSVTPAAAENREQRPTTWEGLSVVVGKKVRIVMPDGARIEGVATVVKTDALAVKIARSSNLAVYPRGEFLVPRATLKAVETQANTHHWSIVTIAVTGAIGGFLAVLAIAISRGNIANRPSVVGGLAAGAVGIPTAGIVLGRRADRRTVTYVITP